MIAPGLACSRGVTVALAIVALGLAVASAAGAQGGR